MGMHNGLQLLQVGSGMTISATGTGMQCTNNQIGIAIKYFMVSHKNIKTSIYSLQETDTVCLPISASQHFKEKN